MKNQNNIYIIFKNMIEKFIEHKDNLLYKAMQPYSSHNEVYD